MWSVLPVPSPAGMVTIATTGCRNKKGTRFGDVRAVSKIEQKVVTMSAGEGTGSTELRRSNAPAVRNCVGRTHRQYGIATVRAPAVRNCDGRGPVAFRKSGEKPHLPFSQWEDPESRLRLRTRRLEKALLLRCSDAEVDQDRARYNGVDHTGTVPAAHKGIVQMIAARPTAGPPYCRCPAPYCRCPHRQAW